MPTSRSKLAVAIYAIGMFAILSFLTGGNLTASLIMMFTLGDIRFTRT